MIKGTALLRAKSVRSKEAFIPQRGADNEVYVQLGAHMVTRVYVCARARVQYDIAQCSTLTTSTRP